MARSKKNLATDGLSGRVGNLVYKHRKKDGKTFVSSLPVDNELEPTDNQKTVRTRFQMAVLYGQSVVADPDEKAEYEAKAKGGQSAYNVAVADFFNAPSIEEVDLTGYTGQIGDEIRIAVIDDFDVKQVGVTIQNADGTLVEQGLAAQEDSQIYWVYAATTLNADLSGDKIIITATDRPDNSTEQELVL